MKKRVWHFKRGQEVYTVLYEDDRFILVQNDRSKKYSFGMARDFGTLFGFPVDWSCLNAEKAIEVLKGLKSIDEKYLDSLGEIAKANIERWQNMIKAIET